MKKKEAKKQTKNNKHEKEDIEKETHAAWVEKTKERAEAMLALAYKKWEQEQAARVARFGRWSPVIDAIESVAYAAFDVAEQAVRESPRERAKVHRVREVVLARLCGDEGATASLADVTFTAGLFAELVDHDFNLGIAAVPDALAAALAAREIRDAVSGAFARL